MCPCCSEKKYQECCGPYHAGVPAPTPLALMRSRYSGYALKKVDYIIATTHPTIPIPIREEIVRFSEEMSFDGLEILAVEGDSVTFRAHISKQGKDLSFTEKSHFVKLDEKWLYAGHIAFG